MVIAELCYTRCKIYYPCVVLQWFSKWFKLYFMYLPFPFLLWVLCLFAKNTKSNYQNAHKRISILFWDIYVEIKFVTVSFNSKYYFCTYLLASLKFAQLILYIHPYLWNWPFFEKNITNFIISPCEFIFNLATFLTNTTDIIIRRNI